MSDQIRYGLQGHVATIEINRPDKRNALTIGMVRSLADAFGQYSRDRDARCLVVHASGSHFCGGLDLAGGATRMMTEGGSSFLSEGGIDPWGVLTRRVHKPVMTAVRGYCFTAGVELMLAADVNIAGSDAKLAQLEVTRGIGPFGGATVRMPQAIGWHNAMRWLLTGDILDAAEAHRIGLVQEVTEPEAVLERALAIAGRIASAAPLAVEMTLRTARQAVDAGREMVLKGLYSEARSLWATDDAQLGIATFLDRQRPSYAGR